MNEPASSSGAAPAAPAPGGVPEVVFTTNPIVVTAARLVSFAHACVLLFWGKVVAIPVALAVLLSFMLNPLVKRIHRTGLPRPASVGVTTVLAVAALVSLTWLIGSQLASLNDALPGYKEKITAKVRDIRGAMEGGAVEKFQDTMSTVAEEMDKPRTPAGTPTGEKPAAPARQEEPVPVYLTTGPKLLDFEGFSALLPVLDSLTTAGLVLLLVVMMLLRWEDMRSRLISFSGHKNLTVATKASDDAGRRITRYLMMQFIINGSYGAVVWIGLFFLRVDYAPLWGLCAALFRYVPYIGPVAAAALPIAFSFITSDGWEQPLWVAGMIVVLELVSNNLIEPWLYGSRLGLSAMGIIVAAVAWTFLWGPVGLVMSTPLTVILVVLGEYLPAFSIFSRLLGDKPVMEPHFQLYQRLLAHDEVEVTALVRDLLKQKSLGETLDEVFIPALALAKRDEAAGLLEKGDTVYIATTAERIFETFRTAAEEKEREEQAETPNPAALHRTPILVWPSGELALTAARFLQWFLRDSAAGVVVLPPQSLAGEVIEAIHSHRPAAVCLLHLSGADATRARQYLKKLKSGGPPVPLIMARLGVSGTLDTEVRDSFRESGANGVTRTLQETAAAILPHAQDTAQLVTPATAPG